MPDNESNITLRKYREKLGYGLGWTFKDALIDWTIEKLAPPCLFIFGILLYILFIYLYTSILERIFHGS